MIHFSCDRCKRMLDPNDDVRYILKVEAYPATEPLEVNEIEDDRDHLSEIQEILERMDDAEIQCVGDGLNQKQRFDLCADCYKEFIKNPVGRELAIQLGFSQN